MKTLNDIKDLETGRLIVLFSTKWCGDCIVLDQYIDEVVEMYRDDFEFIYADRDEHIELAKHYNIFGIPSFLCLNDGEKIGDFVSKEGKTKDQVVDFIEEMKGNLC